ncbi:MAG TPA: autotransporter outer membrane beta-barrel domain-containing protein [Rickettsia endosymbiont of Degeeriella rufa]|nr:autotransporter outer membrane beta-barrel domain-containing protein [Rickettsia endosymbiont of Degeeriella rufa]
MNTLGAEEKKALRILYEVLDDSIGYSSGCSTTSSSHSDWRDATSISSTEGYDTVYTSSDSEYDFSSEQVSSNSFEVIEDGRNFDTAVTRTQEEASVTIDVSDESEVSAPSDPVNHNTLRAVDETELAISATANDLDDTNLGIDLDIESDDADITVQHVNTTQTSSLDEETLLQKAEALSYISHEELRVARKVASNHIKQRMFERSMLVAVAAGDERESDQSQILGYSVWSRGAFGSAKHKTSYNSNGYSSKILGGSIGAYAKFENDLLVGSSFSKIRSNIKHASQKVTKKLNTYIASLYGTSPIKENLTLGVIGSAGFSPKPRSKLLSLESHLNYQIALPHEITLIPNIGLKYEYERSKTHQEQIDGNISVAHAKKSYQAFSTEIGSRVIFAPI